MTYVAAMATPKSKSKTEFPPMLCAGDDAAADMADDLNGVGLRVFGLLLVTEESFRCLAGPGPRSMLRARTLSGSSSGN